MWQKKNKKSCKLRRQQRESSSKTVVKIFCNKSQKWYPSTMQYFICQQQVTLEEKIIQGHEYQEERIIEGHFGGYCSQLLRRNPGAPAPTDDAGTTPQCYWSSSHPCHHPLLPPSQPNEWSSVPTTFQSPTSASIDKPYLESSYQGSLEKFPAACNSEERK